MPKIKHWSNQLATFAAKDRDEFRDELTTLQMDLERRGRDKVVVMMKILIRDFLPLATSTARGSLRP